MSETLEYRINRWTAKRKSGLVVEIIHDKTTVAEASRAHDVAPSEIEGWVDYAKKGRENALKANPLDVREQYEKQLKDLHEAYGEAMLELRARKKLQALLSEDCAASHHWSERQSRRGNDCRSSARPSD